MQTGILVPSTSPFGERLRTVRQACNVTQYELSLRCGYHHSTLSRLESGEREPSRKSVARLAAELRLSAASPDRAALFRLAGFWPQSPWPAAALAIGEVLDETGLSPGTRDRLELALAALTDARQRGAS